jgi:hypothetical protein
VAGPWAVGLAVVCGVPDGIFGSGQHLALIDSTAVAAVVMTIAAAVAERSRMTRQHRRGPGGTIG